MSTCWMDEKHLTNIQQLWNKPYTELQKYTFSYLHTLQVYRVLSCKPVLAFQKQHCINMMLVREKFLLKQVPPPLFSSLFTPAFIHLLSASIFHLHPRCVFPQTHRLKPTKWDFSILFDLGLAYQGVLQGSYSTYNFTQPQIYPSYKHFFFWF